MLSRYRSLTAAIALMLTACSHEVTPPQSAASSLLGDSEPIIADSVHYTLEPTSTGWRGEIGYTFTNTTDEQISLLNCNGDYALELLKLEGGQWVEAYSPPVRECLSPPIEIMPGASVEGEVQIFAGHTGSNYYPQFTVPDIDGTYRIVIESAYSDYDHDGPPWGETLPLESRISNSFEIRTR